MEYIYTLSHPISNEIRYVGKTCNLKRRYYQHTNKKNLLIQKTYVANWCLSLLNKGIRPIMEIIDESENNWRELEIYWIAQFRAWGFNLCNISEGGQGNYGYKWSEEMKEVQRQKRLGVPSPLKGRKYPQEWCNNISKGRIGIKRSEKTKKDIAFKNSIHRKDKPSNARKSVIHILKDGKEIDYPSSLELAKFLGVSTPYISKSIKNKSKTKYGKFKHK